MDILVFIVLNYVCESEKQIKKMKKEEEKKVINENKINIIELSKLIF
jgi:hypothetical protein